jgi:hypothetical protein
MFIIDQLSSERCIKNSNFGAGNGFIWVSDGCQATFELLTNGKYKVHNSHTILEEITSPLLALTNKYLSKCTDQKINLFRVEKEIRRINVSVASAMR